MSPDISWRGARTAELDAFVRQRLSYSVLTIAEALEDTGSEALGETYANDLTAALASVRETSARPGLFALYHEMAEAACEDRAQDVGDHLRVFARVALDPAPLISVATLRDEDLGDGLAALYSRMVDDDEAFALRLQAADENVMARMRALTVEARDLIATADSAFSTEIDILGRQIVIADGRAGAAQFGGAATFFLWGALVVNPAMNPDRLTLAESLVHESGHALLFGLAHAEPLVLNAPDEVFASPLRADPRPMEGLVHATYVCARMARFMELVQARCDLSSAEREKAQTMAHESRKFFSAGMETVRAHARFSPVGRAVFESEAAALLD